MTAEEFYNEKKYPEYDKFDKKVPKFDYYDMLDFAEAYHKAKVEAISDERPNIKETLGDISLMEAHEEYKKSPLLYMHIKLLDNYIDKLLNK